jgi:PKD repeat protein
MKKILLFVVSVFVAATMFAQGAAKGEIQCLDLNARMERGTRDISDWGSFTNFTATDMNGVSHNIQSYLDQGKYVAIDFFCAWCGPCWQYHQSGIFEALYETYGQGGTQEFVVLMVETETSNTAAQITGTHTANTYAGASQGDFTNGGENPIPIVDATSNLATNVSLYEGYVPSIYLFCPSGYVAEINDYFINDAGTDFLSASEGAQNLYNFATTNCPSLSTPPMVEITAPTATPGVPATISATVLSLGDVTYAWTFEGGNPATANTQTVDVTWNTTGLYNVSLTVTNAGGSTTKSAYVNVVDCEAGISQFPFEESFEGGLGCWTSISNNTANDENAAHGYGVYGIGSDIQTQLATAHSGNYTFRFSSYAQASDYTQYLISPELNLGGEGQLSFWLYAQSTNYGAEKCQLMTSTTDNAPASFANLGSEIQVSTAQTWEEHTATLPANTKYIALKYTVTSDTWYLGVDDVRITAPGVVGINNDIVSDINIYPNPTTGIVNIDADGLNKVVVYDVTGRMMMSVANESTIDISNLEAGVYFFSVETANGSAMKKLVKE